MTVRSERGSAPATVRSERGSATVRSERGSAVLEFLVVTVVFLVPLLYALVTMEVVQRAMLGTSSAAREAGRVYLATPTDQARDRAEQAAGEILANYGLRDTDRLSVQVRVGCERGTACRTATRPGEFRPGAEVEVTVSYRVPVAGRLQGILSAELPVRSVHLTRGR